MTSFNIGLALAGAARTGAGAPTPPAGKVFLVNRDGAYLVNPAGAYLVRAA